MFQDTAQVWTGTPGFLCDSVEPADRGAFPSCTALLTWAVRLGLNLTPRGAPGGAPPLPLLPRSVLNTEMLMSEKPARDKPRRVNMQARAASPARTGSLSEASYTPYSARTAHRAGHLL